MLEIISLPFFQRAIIVGVIMAITAALLGVFVVIRRMSFFTDAVSHASLTGVAIALLAGIHPFIGALIMSIFVGLLVSRLQKHGKQEVDTIIGVLFSTTLAGRGRSSSLLKTLSLYIIYKLRKPSRGRSSSLLQIPFVSFIFSKFLYAP